MLKDKSIISVTKDKISTKVKINAENDELLYALIGMIDSLKNNPGSYEIFKQAVKIMEKGRV